MIIAELLDIFLFLSYSVIYSYVSFLMRLIEIIKILILLFILLHLSGVAITRLAEGCTPLLLAAASSSSCIMNCAKAEDR